MYSGPDKRQASIPATTFKAMFTSARPSNLVYKPRTAGEADALKANLYNVLGGRYRFDPSDRRAISIWDTREDARIVNNIAVGIQMFLGIIGALTLFVAGMGVANIMYASVKERTREIGVKMAIGAKSRQVMAPFVIQSLVITMFGGAIGTSVALVLMFLISLLPLDNVEALELLGRPTFSLPIAVATTFVLGLVGTLAGYFPARRAATISPAESLRYE
jgi:putative ABC transport system permease protein